MLVVVTVLGFCARIALSWISLGSNDWKTWRDFGALSLLTGPYAYEIDPGLNHPPIPVLWAAFTYLLACFTQISKFPFLFRLPAIAADLGSCLLLRKICLRRGGDARLAWLAAAAMAWNLDAILIGAYHCNTDNICAYFMLLAAYLLADRRSPGRAGVALAAAINIKLVPVLLIPVLLVCCENWRAAGRFVLGLLAGLPPFLVMLALVPHAFIHNAIGYTPAAGEWGVMLFIMYSQYLPLTAALSGPAMAWMTLNGKNVILAAIAVVSAVALFRRRRWDAYELCAIAIALFLILTPGFGFQYTVYVAPLFLAVNLRRGAIYGLVAGLYCLTAYAGTWTARLPLESFFTGKPNPLPVPIGLVAWSLLVSFALKALWRPSGKKGEAGQSDDETMRQSEGQAVGPS